MIELEFEPRSINLLQSLLFLCSTEYDIVGRNFGAVVEQGEMKMICEYCSGIV